MSKIHGLIYIIVGLFVSSISWKLNYAKLFLFFYLGLIFIIVGIVKLILGPKANKEEMKPKSTQRNLHQSMQRQHYKRCQRCGNIARIHDNFCSRCGTRI